jgi:quercetin dioxygenase-like cupin family protein
MAHGCSSGTPSEPQRAAQSSTEGVNRYEGIANTFVEWLRAAVSGVLNAMKTVRRSEQRRITIVRIVLSASVIIAAILGIFAFPAHQPEIRRVDLQRHDLSAPGREAIQVRVEFDSGAAFGNHHHPGEEVVYVIEGTLEYTLEGRTERLKAGDVLFVPSGVVHAAKNVGPTRGAELATYIVEKGKPLVVMDE